MNLWYVVGVIALLILAFIVHRFIVYKREADAEDRAAEETPAQQVCEHRAAPQLGEDGILRCPDCGLDMDA